MIDEEREGLIEEACGIIALAGAPRARLSARLLAGLRALQHRGQDAAGVAWCEADGRGELRSKHVLGRVPLKDGALMQLDEGLMAPITALGHVRYRTAGSNALHEAQPLLAHTPFGQLALAHNGHLHDTERLRRDLAAHGAGVTSATGDSALLLHAIASSPERTLQAALCHAVADLRGAFSVVIMSQHGDLFAARDARGIRPLIVGRAAHNEVVVASETVALDALGARFEREVAPGEVLWWAAGGASTSSRSFWPMTPAPRRSCVFETIYFASPESRLERHPAYRWRQALGEALAEEEQFGGAIEAVVAVPQSAEPAARGFAERLGVPLVRAISRRPEAGRSFLEATPEARLSAARAKFEINEALVRGCRLAVIDDSLVRGTTARAVVALLKDAGAREIHFRVASPPMRAPCHYGIDTPTRAELIAADQRAEALCARFGVDSLGYLSLQGMRRAVGGSGHCEACFTGRAP